MRLLTGIVVFFAVQLQADIIHFDLVDGLAANIPTGATGTPAAQAGVDGWFYKYEPVTPFGGFANNPISRNPGNFRFMELGRDGTTGSYGWAANSGFAINSRGVARNGNWGNRAQQNGTAPGDALFAVAENSAQVVIEWQAPETGSADVAFELNGRDHADADLQWHIGTWDGASWTDHGFVVVAQAATPTSPATLSANGIELATGESIYLYGHVFDHDAFDGTQIRGGITLTTIPEPSATSLLLLGLLMLRNRIQALGPNAAT